MKYLKKNWFFIILILGLAVAYITRFHSLETPVVSLPDTSVYFCSDVGGEESDGISIFTQTWQCDADKLSAVTMPFTAEDTFSADISLVIDSPDGVRVLETAPVHYDFTAGTAGSLRYDFKRLSLNRGSRYSFTFTMSNPTDFGALEVPAGSNYGGCCFNSVDMDAAAALIMTTVKFSKLFWLLAVLLPILGFSLIQMMVFDVKWEEAAGLSILLEGLIMYFFGFMGHLTMGMNIVYALSLAALLGGIVLYNLKRKELKNLLSPGFFIYWILFLVILATNAGDWLGNRDELRHWGIAVRDMFYYNGLANHEGCTLILDRYLPFAGIIEYVFEYMNGIFSEDILYIAYQTMLLSFGIIVTVPLGKAGGIMKKLIFPILTLMLFVPIFFFENLPSNILVDSLQAFMAAYALILFYDTKLEVYDYLRITCVLAALTLTKEMGLVFSGMIAFIIFGDFLAEQIRNKKADIKKLLYPVLCVVMVLALYLGWQGYLNREPVGVYAAEENTLNENASVEESEPAYEMQGAADDEASFTIASLSEGKMSIGGIINILKGDGEPYQYMTTRNFLTELFDGETYKVGPFGLSFVDLLGILAVVVLVAAAFGYFGTEKKRMKTLAVLILIDSIFLCMFLQVTYWFSFAMYEAMELTSFSRYFAPYAYGVTVLILYLLIKRLGEEQPAAEDAGVNENGAKAIKTERKYVAVYALSALLIMAVPMAGIVTESRNMPDSTSPEVMYGHDQIKEILRSVANKGERAFFVCSHSDGYSEYIFRNTVCPIVSEHQYWNPVADQKFIDAQKELYKDNLDDNSAVIMEPYYWNIQLQECKYLVVFHADDLFRESYKEWFDDDPIEDGSVYRVDKDEEFNVSLHKIGQTGIREWH